MGFFYFWSETWISIWMCSKIISKLHFCRDLVCREREWIITENFLLNHLKMLVWEQSSRELSDTFLDNIFVLFSLPFTIIFETLASKWLILRNSQYSAMESLPTYLHTGESKAKLLHTLLFYKFVFPTGLSLLCQA